jgi:signal transduction histidine kinase
MFFQRWKPRSLRRQFLLVLIALSVLIAAGSLVAVHAVRQSAVLTRQLAGERLVQMDEAQELAYTAMQVELETYRMLNTSSVERIHDSYTKIVTLLDNLDSLVGRLGSENEDVSVLALHQAGQTFRNIVHVVAGIQGVEAHDATARNRLKELRRFRDELENQSIEMVATTRIILSHKNDDYRTAVRNLAATSDHSQQRVLALFVGSLITAWLISHSFLGRHILSRLREVSHHLRRYEVGDSPAKIFVQGNDEIGEMARAVEQFMEDRRLLALTNQELEDAYSDLKHAQSSILQQEKMASVGQLAAGVAHEINNPMGFIFSNLQSLGKYTKRLIEFQHTQETTIVKLVEIVPDSCEPLLAELNQRRKEMKIERIVQDIDPMIQESLEGAERVKQIVQNLKSFSRLDENEFKKANINEGLESTLSIVWNELKYKATVEKSYGDIPDILCKAGQLNQVFLNLLVNAGQAIENQGKIEIKTWQENNNVFISVTDNGSGIPSEKISRIFEPFFTTKPVGKGTGLGLSIAYDIIKSHYGEIRVDSHIGEGTCFTIRLPIKDKVQQTD